MKNVFVLALLASAGVASAIDIDPVGSNLSVLAGNYGARTVLYNNLPGPGEGVFSTGSSPRSSVGDDVVLNTTNATLTGTNFVFIRQAGSADTVDVRIRVWDNIVGAGDFSGLLGTTTVGLNLTGLPNGAYFSGPVALPNIGVADGDCAVSFEFFDAAGAYAAGYTMAFDGTGVNVGSSQDVYWRDGAAGGDGLNGNYVSGEARTFGGGANLANLAFELTGVPTPGSLALLGLGGLVAGRRRR